MVVVGMGPLGMVMLGAGAEEFGPAVATAAMGLTSLALLLAILGRVPAVRRVESAV